MSNGEQLRGDIGQEFLESLKIGELSQLTEIVKSDKELIMCFRNNYINVYYKGHSLFKITRLATKYKVEFNMGHARYTEPGERNTKWDELRTKIPGVNLKERDLTAISVMKNGKAYDFKPVIGIYKEFINDFMDSGKQTDYFKKEDGMQPSEKTKNNLIEKQHQQRLFSEYFFTNSEYVFFDMELTIPGCTRAGSPDCLALRMENGEPKAVVFVEVKSTEGACSGKHGVKKHSGDFKIIKEDDVKTRWIKASAVEIFKCYKYLGFMDTDVKAEKILIDGFPVEILFVFTSNDIGGWMKHYSLAKQKKMLKNYK